MKIYNDNDFQFVSDGEYIHGDLTVNTLKKDKRYKVYVSKKGDDTIFIRYNKQLGKFEMEKGNKITYLGDDELETIFNDKTLSKTVYFDNF